MVDAINCKRMIDGAACGTEIPLIKENLSILRPEVPLINAVCPQCHKSQVLNKEISLQLAEEHFKEDIAAAIEESETESNMPSLGIGTKVKETLELLGYSGKKWKDKLKTITEFVRTTPMYQNPDGLYRLLAAWGIDVQHIPLIIQKVFGGYDYMAQQQFFNFGSGGYPGANMPGMNMPGAFNNQPGGYTMQQTPTGQIILIPPTAPAPQPTVNTRSSHDETVVEEIIEDGVVVKRIIKGPLREHKDDREDPTLKLLSTLKDLGFINNSAQHQAAQPAPAVSPEIRETLDELSGAVAALGSAMGGRRTDDKDDEIRALTDMVKQLTNKIDTYEKEKDADERKALRDELSSIRSQIVSIGSTPRDPAPAAGLSDTQFQTHTKHKSLITVSESADRLSSKIAEPLNEMVRMQSKLNALLLLRDAEKQDGVAPGTYLKVMQPQPVPSDTQVASTVQKWKERAAEAKVGGE